jgi:hypothetical protein
MAQSCSVIRRHFQMVNAPGTGCLRPAKRTCSAAADIVTRTPLVFQTS